jgi:hypothetical protein
MGLFKKQGPSEAFAAEEQARAEALTRFVAENASNPNYTIGLWRECAQEAQANAAAHTAQPERRWGK